MKMWFHEAGNPEEKKCRLNMIEERLCEENYNWATSVVGV